MTQMFFTGTSNDSRSGQGWMRPPVKPGMTCGTDMTMLLSDALSCKVQIANKIGLKFQQNLLKVNTNIVLYQILVKDTILQI